MPPIRAVKVVNGTGAAADRRGESAYETATGNRSTKSSTTAPAFHRFEPRQAEPTVPRPLSHIT